MAGKKKILKIAGLINIIFDLNSNTPKRQYFMNGPNKDIKFPLKNYDRLCFLKNVVKNPNIIVGDYTYYDDFENIENFEKNVKYHFDSV